MTNFSFDIFLICSVSSKERLLQLQKEIKVTKCKFRRGRWISENIFLKEETAMQYHTLFFMLFSKEEWKLNHVLLINTDCQNVCLKTAYLSTCREMRVDFIKHIIEMLMFQTSLTTFGTWEADGLEIIPLCTHCPTREEFQSQSNFVMNNLTIGSKNGCGLHSGCGVTDS